MYFVYFILFLKNELANGKLAHYGKRCAVTVYSQANLCRWTDLLVCSFVIYYFVFPLWHVSMSNNETKSLMQLFAVFCCKNQYCQYRRNNRHYRWCITFVSVTLSVIDSNVYVNLCNRNLSFSKLTSKRLYCKIDHCSPFALYWLRYILNTFWI